MRSLATVAAVVLALCAGAGGCAGKQDPSAAGADCYRDEDCQTGLICVADASGNRVCSKDVKSLESMVDGPPADQGTAMPPDAAQGAGGAD